MRVCVEGTRANPCSCRHHGGSGGGWTRLEK